MYYATANPSTAQTNAVLIPAAPDRRVVVEGMYISSDTEMAVSLLNGTSHTLLHRMYVGARGGMVINLETLGSLKTAKGEGLDLTTSATGNVFIGIWYRFGT